MKTGQSIEELYLGEKKKSQILMSATVLLSLALVGSITAYVKKPTASSNTFTPPSQFAGGPPGSGENGGQFRMGFQDMTQFFKDDGSVDTAQLDELTSRLPAGASDRFLERLTLNIDQAVTDGKLTQDQATKLKAALEERAANAQ